LKRKAKRLGGGRGRRGRGGCGGLDESGKAERILGGKKSGKKNLEKLWGRERGGDIETELGVGLHGKFSEMRVRRKGVYGSLPASTMGHSVSARKKGV